MHAMTKVDGTHIVNRICDAVQFLLARQDSDGFWRDYALPPGPAVDWVTAFTGFALSCVPPDITPHEPVQRALNAVRADCRPSGWGYNQKVATDADTTSWVVRWFIRSSARLPVDAPSVLASYLGPQGGARTFVCGDRYGTWTNEHADVTAVLGLAMKEGCGDAGTIHLIRDWMLAHRNNGGLWDPFWWTFDSYANARALEFLNVTGGIPDSVTAASRSYLDRHSDPSSSMETANLLIMATHTGSDTADWICRLTAQQVQDGGWPASRVLKVPSQRTASVEDAAFEDGNRVMSTAMAVIALAGVLEHDRVTT